MPNLADLSLKELLDSFAAPTPTPGGGSAAALAGALGASLLIMVAAMPKTRTGVESERTALDGVLRQLGHGRDHLAQAIERDSASYDAVIRAYRLPKNTEDEKRARTAAIQAALHGATEVPLDVMRACHAAAREGLTVARFGNLSAASDVKVAFELLQAAAAAAAANARVNLASVHDSGFAAGAEAEARRLSAAMQAVASEAHQAVDQGM